jgi:CubicO group peptidase (beta-lactamase class C family)
MLQDASVSVEIHGTVAPRFARVRDAFADNLGHHGDVGAACAVYQDGRLVVDLWGGLADPGTGRPWAEDTLGLVFSTTKGMTAVCAHRLAERGALDLDAPIARYWPAFAAAGKERITVRAALSHRAGLAAVDGDLTLDEVLAWDPVVAAIAAQAPNWEPGTRHGYHARSYGWIAGEIARRITGKTLGRIFADEVARPLGLDFWIGLPEVEEPRVARILPAPPPADPAMREFLALAMGPTTLLGRVLGGPSQLFAYDDMWNRRALHAAEMPSSNGIGSARAIARMYAAVVGEVDGVRLLRPETLAAACAVQSDGEDVVLRLPTRFGTGFMLPPTLCPFAPSTAFGHPGAGGSLGFGDPAARIGFGYVMNQMKLGMLGDLRAARLAEAVYASLG